MSTKSFPVIDMVATGKNIVRLRKESGLSVADLQDYFGFEAPQAIYKWQKGQSLPSTDNLCALAVLFEVSIEDILILRKPQIQILPQDNSCGSGRFGLFHFLGLIRMLQIFFKGFTEAIVIPPIRAAAIATWQILRVHPSAIDICPHGFFRLVI